MEIVTAARDSTMEELQIAHQQVQDYQEEISKLKGKFPFFHLSNIFYFVLESLKKSEAKFEEVQNEFKLSRESSGMVERHMEDQNRQLENAKEEINRLNAELKSAIHSKEVLFFCQAIFISDYLGTD